MELWGKWLILVNYFDEAFSRKKTFFWFVIILIGFTIKFDSLGVTSLARGAGLLPAYYTCMLNFFISTAVNLEKLQLLWISIVFKHFNSIVRINGRCIIAGDGIKIGKEGKKMPAVKWLHQASESNSKAEHIMGHSIQAVSILANGLRTYFAIPLAGQIHEGIRLHYTDSRTLLDKMFELLIGLNLPEACYFVADKYYCSGRFIKQLISKNIHLVTMMKKNAVAYYPAKIEPKGHRGRPKKYGKKTKLFDLFKTELPFIKAPMPGNSKLMIEYYQIQLLWKPLGELVQFVLTRHPTRGEAVAMSTDLTLDPLCLIFAYSLRFKIEVMFKQAVHQAGVFLYRFWLRLMSSRKRGSGDQNLQFAPKRVKEKIANKVRAYHLFILLGFIAQGLMQHLSIHYRDIVWKNFGTWLRTVRVGTLPSEMVVASAMKNTYAEFLIEGEYGGIFKKFMRDKVDIKRLRYLIPIQAQAA
jgi:hypothetical protein